MNLLKATILALAMPMVIVAQTDRLKSPSFSNLQFGEVLQIEFTHGGGFLFFFKSHLRFRSLGGGLLEATLVNRPDIPPPSILLTRADAESLDRLLAFCRTSRSIPTDFVEEIHLTLFVEGHTMGDEQFKYSSRELAKANGVLPLSALLERFHAK